MSEAMRTLPAWFVASPLLYRRRRTRAVRVGSKVIGGDHPILVQSMCTTDTLDTEATVAQCLRMVQAGCELLRITAPTPRHAKNLGCIREELWKRGCREPIAADIHFMPEAAMEAVLHVEKVRINPGNYADSKRFVLQEYSDAAYAAELARLEERFTPLVLRCRQLGRAMRIGTNHGSLSDRILNRFGDTPLGMVESALEFLRIARRLDYHDIVLSMKSSNPRVMIEAYRLLVKRLDEEDMDYPLHLGVTEAGDGEDGRVKSAAGIGTLLEDGLGDTLRVSLTEDPELEMPVAYRLAKRYPAQPAALNRFLFDGVGEGELSRHWMESHPLGGYARQQSGECKLGDFHLSAKSLVRVFTQSPFPAAEAWRNWRWFQDYRYSMGDNLAHPEIMVFDLAATADLQGLAAFAAYAKPAKLPVVGRMDLDAAKKLAAGMQADMLALSMPPGPLSSPDSLEDLLQATAIRGQAVLLEFPQVAAAELLAAAQEALDLCERLGLANVLISVRGCDASALLRLNRALSVYLEDRTPRRPLLLSLDDPQAEAEELRLSAATLFGSLLCDGVGDALLVRSGDPSLDTVSLCFSALQAARVRISKTEFISCPSCGRTLFDLQEVTARVKARTSHLVGVKIAIMGCIVNGPGEMADADFGYVGGAPGKINLYAGKECVEKGIPMQQAEERLVELIKKFGMWQEPARGGT